MTAHLKAFLQFMRLNRNASAHTVRAYESDLSQFLGHVGGASGYEGRRPSIPARSTGTPSAVLSASCTSAGSRGPARRGSWRRCARSCAICAARRSSATIRARWCRRPSAKCECLPTCPRTKWAPCSTPPTAPHPSDGAIGRFWNCSMRPGCGSSELAGLDLEDVNLSARMARVLGKGGKERLVPFNTTTASALRVYLRERETLVRGREGRARQDRRAGSRRGPSSPARLSSRSRPEDPLFVNYRGGRLTVRSIDRLVRRYVAASGVRDRHQPACPQAFLRDASTAARRRPARDSGAPRPRAPQHHRTLHARECRAVARGVQESPSASGEEFTIRN